MIFRLPKRLPIQEMESLIDYTAKRFDATRMCAEWVVVSVARDYVRDAVLATPPTLTLTRSQVTQIMFTAAYFACHSFKKDPNLLAQRTHFLLVKELVERGITPGLVAKWLIGLGGVPEGAVVQYRLPPERGESVRRMSILLKCSQSRAFRFIVAGTALLPGFREFAQDRRNRKKIHQRRGRPIQRLEELKRYMDSPEWNQKVGRNRLTAH